MLGKKLLAVALAILPSLSQAATSWSQVKIGGGGGFSPGIIFSTAKRGVAYLRTDIGGLYKLNSDDSWTPLLDFADSSTWNYWGVDAVALHPTDADTVYAAVGMYTIDWDPNNGSILKSTDSGSTWSVAATLPFKVGGNMPGRGIGERLAIDPNAPGILYLGARSGNGLWKSTDSGATWNKVTSFTSVGTYIQDSSSAYTGDIIGLAWVTFDPSSGSSGSASSRIFVGVASVGENNVFVSEDSGATWSAVAGQDTTYLPHKGVIGPTGNLYISYSNGGGPYDGTLGSVWKYDIANSQWTDITPVSGSDLYFGFGGLGVDTLVPGTIMVAALNSWWPDGQIFRSTDDGATWTPLWSWASYPERSLYYSYDLSLAPWIAVKGPDDEKEIGWMMEALVIDPFDSDHWLYGTGLTVYGGHDLTKWDSVHNITLKSLADGIEETAILALTSPPSGPPLVSGVGDVGGFVHTDLTEPPTTPFVNPIFATTHDLDYAGQSPSTIIRIGSNDNDVAISSDAGSTWSQYSGDGTGNSGGKVALSAAGTTILWRSTNGVLRSQNSGAFSVISSVPSGAVIASDKVLDTTFYAASGATIYLSTDTGATFTAAAGTLGSSTTANDIIVNPSVTGDIWITTDKGVFHSTDSGATISAIDGFTAAYSISAGAPKTTGGDPAIYVFGVYQGTSGVFFSSDGGSTWTQIDDSKHRFGSITSNVIEGSKSTYGQVFVGTNGRGIFVGTIN